MVSHLNGSHNGNGTVHYLDCPSDYETRPAIDVTPRHKPSWRDSLAPITWSMSYSDSSGITHSVTLRGDTEEEVLEMVKPLVAGVRQAKEKAKQTASEFQAHKDSPDSDVPRCKVHNVPMERRVSKRTGGIYFSHQLQGTRGLCFGREVKA